jgi:hypothetical protein
MSAQQGSFMLSALMSSAQGTIGIGYVVIPSLSGEDYVVASAANLAAAGRSTACAGISLTAASTTNRSFEMQVIGPVPPSITALGTGAAGHIKVDSSGRLARGVATGAELPAGKCDADGWAYINFNASGDADVADDIAKSGGSTIDRVRGLRAIPLVGTDGVTPDIGGSWEYNENDSSNGFKLTKPHVLIAEHHGVKAEPGFDNTAALQALFELAGAAPTTTVDQAVGAREIRFINGGTYEVHGQLSLDYLQYVKVLGPAKLLFTADTVPDPGDALFEILSSSFWSFEDIHFCYSSTTFADILVRTGYGVIPGDCISLKFIRCQFYGTQDAVGNHGAQFLLSLKKAINVKISGCVFTAAESGIWGHDNTLGFVNTCVIEDCIFNKLGNGVPGSGAANGCSMIKNPGEAWTIGPGNTFEPLQPTSGGFVSQNAVYQEDDYFSFSPVIIGNWMGDGDGTGPWIVLGKTLGGSIHGNLISATKAMLLSGCNGLHVSGNRMGTVEFALAGGTDYNSGVLIAGNSITGAVPYVNTANVQGFSHLNNQDNDGVSSLSTPLRIGDPDYYALYSRVILSGTKTWDPGTVTAGGYAQSDGINWTGSHLGAAFAFGVTPTPPAGVLVDAKMYDAGVVRVQIFNFSGSDYTPGTLTFKFHMWE